MVDVDDGIVILFKDVHDSKQEFPIYLIVEGKSICSNEEYSINDSTSRNSTLLGNTIVFIVFISLIISVVFDLIHLIVSLKTRILSLLQSSNVLFSIIVW